MPKYVHVTAHLSSEELEQRYRKATDAVERSHFQIIWLLTEAKARQGGCRGYGLLCQLDSDSRPALQPGWSTEPYRSAPIHQRRYIPALQRAEGSVTAHA